MGLLRRYPNAEPVHGFEGCREGGSEVLLALVADERYAGENRASELYAAWE